MRAMQISEISLRNWADEDFWVLLRTVGDPVMTMYLGGPETDEKMRSRHEKYLAMNDSDEGKMLVIMAGVDLVPVGTHGYWEKEWQGETIWETGWFVLPEFQNQGVATLATQLIITLLKKLDKHRFLHAYPSIKNSASNAICRKLGFTLQGEYDLEYPKGHWMRCNDWQIDLKSDS